MEDLWDNLIGSLGTETQGGGTKTFLDILYEPFL